VLNVNDLLLGFEPVVLDLGMSSSSDAASRDAMGGGGENGGRHSPNHVLS
jgi:hypothetical protein